MDLGDAPILSTPAEQILEEPTVTASPPSDLRLSEEQLYVQYEIKRTIKEIRAGRWKRIALQFPDEMLADAPRVFERLRDGLKAARDAQSTPAPDADVNHTTDSENSTAQLQEVSIDSKIHDTDASDESLCILADTSYGACCVDEIAAEHVDAEVVVHYGRACLSPTARLPVIYIFTSKPIDLDAAVSSFQATYPDLEEKVCLVADVPYAHSLPALKLRLDAASYRNVFQTDTIRDPSSPLPNRTIPAEARGDPDALREFSVFHLSSPPPALLLILSSRIRSLHIFPASPSSPVSLSSSSSSSSSVTPLLRRRYASLLRLSRAPVIGILINTLSVANYLDALAHCERLVARAGKKSYVFVVGKLNPAKLANFSEVEGWVVIGCWESSLLDDKKGGGEFFKPVITPFELEVALMEDEERVWGEEWVGDFGELLKRERGRGDGEDRVEDGEGGGEEGYEDEDEDEPPEFDLRTGRYVSHTRPMGRRGRRRGVGGQLREGLPGERGPGSALVQRAKGDVATVGGQVSPAAEFLRSKRTWQGLGSDYEIAYERDENGKIRGAVMEEGRAGVARGYTVGGDGERS